MWMCPSCQKINMDSELCINCNFRIKDAFPVELNENDSDESPENFELELIEVRALLRELEHSYLTSGSNPIAYQAITRMMRFVREHELDSGNSKAT